MHRLLFFLLPFLLSIQAPAQEKRGFITGLKKQYFSTEKDSSRNGSFIVLPAFGYAQETGVEYGLVSTYDFYTNKENLLSRTSNLTFAATLTTNKQKNIKLNTDIWTDNNTYRILSELRYRDWPFNFYGLGNSTLHADEDYLGQKLARVKLDVERKVSGHMYIGVNSIYEYFKMTDIEAGGIFESPDIIGQEGGQYFALGTSFLLDSRDVTTYSTRGTYVRVKYAYAPDFWKGDNFTGSLIEMDSRVFYSPLARLTIAAQALYRGSLGRQTPYYVYRNLGGSMNMRGYYLGRYNGKNYAASQAEIRYRVIPRLGVVAFSGWGSTFSEQHKFRTIASHGGGIRYFFSLQHNSTIRLDYAFGEKRPGEKRQSGFYLSLSEAF